MFEMSERTVSWIAAAALEVKVIPAQVQATLPAMCFPYAW